MKIITTILFVALIYSACQNPDEDKLANARRKSNEAKCKVEKLQEISQYDAILVLAVRVGLKKDYEKVLSSFGDSTITCGQASDNWDKFQAKLDSISQK
jgi:hypothetical protein